MVQGDANPAALFASLPFDHLVFTGSTAVGRKVAQAAAQNLTPTTLELGGKSPSASSTATATTEGRRLKIAHGKLLNAGQTCIARRLSCCCRGAVKCEFAQAYAAAVARLFPTIEAMATTLPSSRPATMRGCAHAAAGPDAGRRGADHRSHCRQSPWCTPTGTLGDGVSRQMPPTLVFGATSAMQLMREEILAPSSRWSRTSGWTMPSPTSTQVRARWRCYWFGQSEAVRDDVLQRTVSGGVTVSDTLMHIAHDHLPFGGVGDSGWGLPRRASASCSFATRSRCWSGRAGRWGRCCTRLIGPAWNASWR